MSHKRFNFWKNAAGWPRDVGNMLFLAQAVHEVGKARFGEDWTADTPASTYVVDIDKFRAVVDDMARGFAEGRLSYALRPEPSGDFISGLPSHNWNSDLCEEIFDSCQMDSKALPVADRFSLGGSLWVFVPRPSLDTFLQRPVELAGDLYFSPYVRLMLAVSRDLGMSADHQPRKEDIIHALLALSKNGPYPTISLNLAKSAATLMREFESQSGSASPHRKGHGGRSI